MKRIVKEALTKYALAFVSGVMWIFLMYKFMELLCR